MDRQRPTRAWWRPWLAMLAAAWLAACHGLPPLGSFDAAPEPAANSWRVVERLGEARYLAPGMAGWEQVAAGSMVPAGSQIATGIGGRLIVHQGVNQLSASTGSRFILPGWEPGDHVRQTAGSLRYRIAAAPAPGFAIETPFLDLEVGDAVVDVTVGEEETEVAVVSGSVRVKTLDERRQIDMHAGYVGFASLQGDQLAVRRGPAGQLEPVQPLVLPALHADRATRAGHADRATRAGTQPADDGPSVVAAFADRPGEAAEPAAPAPAQTAEVANLPAETLPVAATPGAPSARLRPRGAAGPGSSADAPAAQTTLATADTAGDLRRRFDALTEGLLDGLPPALPPAAPGNGR